MVHKHNRDFLSRTQNQSLVRPELIRSKDGTIDGDGWQCWDCRNSFAAYRQLGPRLIDPTIPAARRSPFWLKRREACDDGEQ